MRRAMLVVVIALLAAAARLIITHHSATQARAAGLVLVATGVPLMVISRAQLGKSFAVGPKATALVTRGLYAKLPHPLYVFFDLVLLGIVIAVQVPWLVAVWLAIIAAQSWQARRESKVLEQAFGEDYRKYRAQTWW